MEPGHEGIQFFIDGKAKVIMGHGKRTYAFKWVLSEVDPAAGVGPCPRGLEGRKGVLCEIPGPRGTKSHTLILPDTETGVNIIQST